MVKFLSGGQRDGERIPLCTYWRNDVTTDTSEDFAQLEGTGETFAQQGKGQNSAIGDFNGQCIANAYFKREDITCFNDGRCDEEGKCLPCSKYTYGGMRMAISHSPPIEILKNFDKGLTDIDLQSPNLVSFPPSAINLVQQDQLPYHILIRNIQAVIAKCCHWNAGDGVPSEFFITPVIDGPETRQVTDINGNPANFKGIIIIHPEFPDTVGTFFPVGTVVVAGFVDQPSFYLEPRTGLFKPGEGVIFRGGNVNSPTSKAKDLATFSTRVTIDAVNAANFAFLATNNDFILAQNFANNANATNNQATIDSANAKLEEAQAAAEASQAAFESAQILGQEANDLVGEVLATETPDDTFEKSKELADKLDELAVEVEITAVNAGGQDAAQTASAQVSRLRLTARQLRFVAFGAETKCEFAFEDNNVAKQWNLPEDGTLPCNGVRTDCDFYTGAEWLFATDEKMDLGQPITGDQLQEVRVRSDDWARFSDPDDEFESRFSTPFIWAFKGYTEIGSQPRIQDMELYRPKVLFGRDTDDSEFETILMDKIIVVNFEDFEVNKQESRVQPGSPSLNLDKPPQFPSIITPPNVPTNTRLKITHPREKDLPFKYRTWAAEKNLISLFGTGSPDATIFLVNNTALKNRTRYNNFLGTRNFINIVNSLPGVPGFQGIFSAELREIFRDLEDEQLLNPSTAPLGFSKVSVDREGFWQSINQIDLIHNQVNEIFAFLLINDFQFIFDSTEIDYRFLHAIMTQTSFQATDFSINDTIGNSQIGSSVQNTVDGAIIEAEMQQTVGNEELTIGQSYFGLRFKNRNLKNTALGVSPDLEAGSQIGDTDDGLNLVVTESDASAFITRVAYNVVQYRKEITVPAWYLIDDCGKIMLRIDDLDLHRVLPLPDQAGDQKALTDVLVNGGVKGSIVAQWALEKVTLTFRGVDKDLGQIFRDPDGVGLPANYVIVGPKADSNEENAFGRPEINRDTIKIQVTFLRPQTAGLAKDDPQQAEPELTGVEVVKDNFYDDLFLFSTNINETESPNFTAGSTNRPDDIQRDQQDYVFVFHDSEGRPIGRKVTRFMVMYYGLSVIAIELAYQWRGSCTTYALFPDFNLAMGDDAGQVQVQPKGVTSPEELLLGFRIGETQVGDTECFHTPSCADHEFASFGGIRLEFESIVISNEFPLGKAFFRSAGQQVPAGISTKTQRPGSIFLIRRGAMWYPYDTCEPPRYDYKTGGPLHTDSTELINEELSQAGIGTIIMTDAQAEGSPGSFGGLALKATEAYRGPDRVTPKILDVHPSLRECTSAYTHANQILQGDDSQFTGGARKRAAVDLFWYLEPQNLGSWEPPPFGNFGRNKAVAEIAEKQGDYLGGSKGDQVGRRWMPMFPEREDLGAGIELWSEELETQHHRLISTSTALGGISETAPTRSSPRFTHKGLIFNRVGGAIEYPFSPYYPSFLPDADLGKEPEDREDDFVSGAEISTMWAWREQEKPIGRGTGDILEGIKFLSPEYIIDNRRLEIRLRPAEGEHFVKYKPPQYNDEGEIVKNASFQLDNGPPRFIKIDFLTNSLSIVLAEKPEDEGSTESFYDTSKEIGDDPFECTPGTATDNLSLSPKCTCETDTQSDDVDAQNLPARFLHLEELASAGFFALYENETIQTPFAVDIPRSDITQPCCQCLYYIRGIFFFLNSGFLPVNRNIDPAFDSRFTVEQKFSYTWSRVPHGFSNGAGQDAAFNGIEGQADEYISFRSGEVFINRFPTGAINLNVPVGTAAFFPSVKFAQDNSIAVRGLEAGDPKLKGGTPVNDDDNSQGQQEAITLDMRFDTYVRIQQVTIRFVAGAGFEVPRVTLSRIDQQNRVGDAVTLRAGAIIATSTLTAVGTDLPNASNFRSADIQDGSVLFPVDIFPSYVNVPFWNQFAQEFHLSFASRSGDNSMGIATIEVRLDTFIESDIVTETITINERKYYTSTGSPIGGNNPEALLSEMDSATGYWRNTNGPAAQGANRNRASAFDTKLEEDGDFILGAPEELELLQEEEYFTARDLMSHPYRWGWESFFPLDEAEQLDFFGKSLPSWTLDMTVDISPIDEISEHDSENLVYGEIPTRKRWNAPGHAWTWKQEEGYNFCCSPCPKTMVIDYNFAHLHDGLAIVETARFWDELPSGFTRLIRSTMMSPDPTFGITQQTGLGITGGESLGPILMDESQFIDSQGNPIDDPALLENVGLLRDPVTGSLLIIDNGGL